MPERLQYIVLYDPKPTLYCKACKKRVPLPDYDERTYTRLQAEHRCGPPETTTWAFSR